MEGLRNLIEDYVTVVRDSTLNRNQTRELLYLTCLMAKRDYLILPLTKRNVRFAKSFEGIIGDTVVWGGRASHGEGSRGGASLYEIIDYHVTVASDPVDAIMNHLLDDYLIVSRDTRYDEYVMTLRLMERLCDQGENDTLPHRISYVRRKERRFEARRGSRDTSLADCLGGLLGRIDPKVRVLEIGLPFRQEGDVNLSVSVNYATTLDSLSDTVVTDDDSLHAFREVIMEITSDVLVRVGRIDPLSMGNEAVISYCNLNVPGDETYPVLTYRIVGFDKTRRNDFPIFIRRYRDRTVSELSVTITHRIRLGGLYGFLIRSLMNGEVRCGTDG